MTKLAAFLIALALLALSLLSVVADKIKCIPSTSNSAPRNATELGIQAFCTTFAGFEFPGDEREAIIYGADAIAQSLNYDIRIQPQTGAVIFKPKSYYADCPTTLGTERCVEYLTKALNSCNDPSADIIKSSSLYEDDTCHWSWQQRLDLSISGQQADVYRLPAPKSTSDAAVLPRGVSDPDQRVGPRTTCRAAPTGISQSRTATLQGIQGFCNSFNGFQIPSDAVEGLIYGATAFAPDVSNGDSIGAVVYKPSPSYKGCSPTINAADCITYLTKALDECNPGQPASITKSGSYTDKKCGWQWQIDLDLVLQRSTGPIKTKTMGAPHAQSKRDAGSPNCWPTDFQWPANALVDSLTAVCQQAAGTTIDPQGTWTRSVNFGGHEQEWIVYSYSGMTLDYQTCMTGFGGIVNGCTGGGMEQDNGNIWVLNA